MHDWVPYIIFGAGILWLTLLIVLSELKRTSRFMSKQQRLEHAQEAVWIDDTLKMSRDILLLNIANDVEFRNKFYGTARRRSRRFDALRDSIAKDPIIAARFIRRTLVSSEVWAQQIHEVFQLMRKEYELESDFVCEINLVNVTDNPVTIDSIRMEALVEDKWVTLPEGDVSHYELAFDKETPAAGNLVNLTARIVPLEPTLWSQIKGVQLVRGAGKQGWVDFVLKRPSSEREKPVEFRVKLIDALGGIHPVVTLPSTPMDGTGRIKHSRKGFEARSRQG